MLNFPTAITVDRKVQRGDRISEMQIIAEFLGRQSSTIHEGWDGGELMSSVLSAFKGSAKQRILNRGQD